MNEMQDFYTLLGQQGGTIHQVGKALGIEGSDLIYGKPSCTYTNSDYMKGQYAFDTCTLEHQRTVLLPQYKGTLDFWLGYKRAAYLKAQQEA